jgi:uracil-DNA glycosylase
MRARDLIRYCRDLGWTEPPELAAPEAARELVPATPPPAPRQEEHGPRPDRRTDAAGCETLDALAAFVDGCSRCRLAEGRRRLVFGEGDPHAPVMFIGEGPGAEEDRTGRPFVGPAGKLLDAMIFALGFERREVFIANVVKCRPPGNRDPGVDEVAACAPFLDRQIELVRPRVIVALGRPAARRLTGSTKPMRALRGSWTSYLGIPLVATFHPAYLLRSPAEKRAAWDDLKTIRRKLDSLTGSR